MDIADSPGRSGWRNLFDLSQSPQPERLVIHQQWFRYAMQAGWQLSKKGNYILADNHLKAMANYLARFVPPLVGIEH